MAIVRMGNIRLELGREPHQVTFIMGGKRNRRSAQQQHSQQRQQQQQQQQVDVSGEDPPPSLPATLASPGTPAPPTPPPSFCPSSHEEDEEEEEEEVEDGDETSRVRLLMRDWLKNQLTEGDIPGFSWRKEDEGVFQIPWKHAARQGWAEGKDALLFRRWAEHTGKFTKGHQEANPKRWKANFRCAINSLPDVEEVKEQTQKKGHNAVKVYRFLPPKMHRKNRRAINGRSRGRRSVSSSESGASPLQPPVRGRCGRRVRTKPSPQEQKEMATVKVESYIRGLQATHETRAESPINSWPGIEPTDPYCPLPSVQTLVKGENDADLSACDGPHTEHSAANLHDHSYSALGFDHIGEEVEMMSSDVQLTSHTSGGRVQVMRRTSTCSLPYSSSPDYSYSADASYGTGNPNSPTSSDIDSDITDENLTDFILDMEQGEIQLIFSNDQNSHSHDMDNIPSTVVGRAIAGMYDENLGSRTNLEIRLPMALS